MHRDYYERRLPHIQPLEGTFFVTFRLEGSMPVVVRQQLQDELATEKRKLENTGANTGEALDQVSRRHFGRYDAYLDSGQAGPMYLKQVTIGQLVADTFHFHDNHRIELISYCVMSNHVHLVFRLLGEQKTTGGPNSLHSLISSVKSYTGRQANHLLGLSGPFWEQEWYDRCVRDSDELIRIVRYVVNNPVKAGLCQQWRDWPRSYIKPEYDMF